MQILHHDLKLDDVEIIKDCNELMVHLKPSSEGTMIRITTPEQVEIKALSIYDYGRFIRFEGMWEGIIKETKKRWIYACKFMGIDNAGIFTVVIDQNQAVKIHINSFYSNYVTVVNQKGKILLVDNNSFNIKQNSTKAIFINTLLN